MKADSLNREGSSITLWSPWHWLRAGACDLWRNPWPGLWHGVVVALFGAGLWWLGQGRFWFVAGAFSGFLLVAPVVATGLYAVSRGMEVGRKVGLRDIGHLWLSGDRRLVAFGVLLGAAGTGWVVVSAALIRLWAPVEIDSWQAFWSHVVLAPSPGLFEVWVLLGGLIVAPVFASSVITLPMLVDTALPMWQVVAQSWRVVGTYPVVMGVWALWIVVLVGAGLLTGLLGLVVVIPVLGHASWHAYRALRQASPVSAAPH